MKIPTLCLFLFAGSLFAEGKFVRPGKKAGPGQKVKTSLNNLDILYLRKLVNIPGSMSVYLGISEKSTFSNKKVVRPSNRELKRQIKALAKDKKLSPVEKNQQLAGLYQKLGERKKALQHVDRAIAAFKEKHKKYGSPYDMPYDLQEEAAHLVYAKANLVGGLAKRQLLLQSLQLVLNVQKGKPDKKNWSLIGFILFEFSRAQDMAMLVKLRPVYRDFHRAMQRENFDFSILMPFVLAETFSGIADYSQAKQKNKKSALKYQRYENIDKAIKRHPGDVRYQSLKAFAQLTPLFFKAVIGCYQADITDFKVQKDCFTADEKEVLAKLETFLLKVEASGQLAKHDLYPMLGALYLIKRNKRRSVYYFELSFNQDPANYAKMELIAALHLLGEKNSKPVKKIITRHEKAVKETSAAAWLWKARAFEIDKQYRMAIKYCKKAGANPMAQLCQGTVLIQQKKFKEAEQVLKPLTGQNFKRSDTAICYLGINYLMTNNNREAYFYLKKAIEKNPDNDKAADVLKRFYY